MSKRDELAKKRDRIESLLPFLAHDRERQQKLLRMLYRINVILGDREHPDPELFRAGRPGEAQMDGRGTLAFTASSPPGTGRLVRIPFYLTSTQPGDLGETMITDAGAGLPAVSVPTTMARLEWAAGAPSKVLGQFETRPLEWAPRLRVAGFVATQRTRPASLDAKIGIPEPILRMGPEPALLVRNLSVGGSANLFPHDAYADAAIYSASVPEFPGLRDQPILASPNTISVNVAVMMVTYGTVATGGYIPDLGVLFPFVAGIWTRPVLSFSLCVLADVLVDTSFGSHVPGPYARRDAIARRPHPKDQGFIL